MKERIIYASARGLALFLCSCSCRLCCWLVVVSSVWFNSSFLSFSSSPSKSLRSHQVIWTISTHLTLKPSTLKHCLSLSCFIRRMSLPRGVAQTSRHLRVMMCNTRSTCRKYRKRGYTRSRYPCVNFGPVQHARVVSSEMECNQIRISARCILLGDHRSTLSSENVYKKDVPSSTEWFYLHLHSFFSHSFITLVYSP